MRSIARFIFEADALEVVVAGKDEAPTENAFVGGRNRWAYNSFINWELWWPGFPVLVYFKESQTKPEGQIHFFPLIFNGKQVGTQFKAAENARKDPMECLVFERASTTAMQVYDVMVERCGPSQTSGPKP